MQENLLLKKRKEAEKSAVNQINKSRLDGIVYLEISSLVDHLLLWLRKTEESHKSLAKRIVNELYSQHFESSFKDYANRERSKALGICVIFNTLGQFDDSKGFAVGQQARIDIAKPSCYPIVRQFVDILNDRKF